MSGVRMCMYLLVCVLFVFVNGSCCVICMNIDCVCLVGSNIFRSWCCINGMLISLWLKVLWLCVMCNVLVVVWCIRLVVCMLFDSCDMLIMLVIWWKFWLILLIRYVVVFLSMILLLVIEWVFSLFFRWIMW